ncbi:phosphotransferase family protein [Natrinema sp. 1APR25-10V2]|uniref:phosphotransferase family protein n=1 Tax=Natrinema sp. 1APR25-10V2 TaxID=2951081 RepID=UPI002875A4FE|nr:phosphotransferase family protein [Natrinema sp. 1APR25-10V2]MDS0476985.1 phosphotransferase family protein [Natrinema sp. 1APR25-10V2]
MTEFSSDTLSTYLSDTLGDGEVSVDDIVAHTEGWSRDTVSFTARYREGGDEVTERLVLRAENELQHDADAESLPGNDIRTEYETLAAAQDAPVPVPRVRWFDEAGGPFERGLFVMDHLEGEPPITWDPRDRRELYDAWDSPDRTLPDQFVDATAGVHAIDGSAVPGIEDVPPDEVVTREIDRWEELYRNAEMKREPAVEEAIRWFRANEPTVPETTLVHGDFRIGNALIDDDRITGLLDWEFARVGDPLFDLGYASTRYFAGKLVEPIERPELACSLLEREWFYDEYERRTGRTVDRERVRYWQAFSAFVMLTICCWGANQYDTGASDDVRNAWFQYPVPGLIEDLLAIIEDDRL